MIGRVTFALCFVVCGACLCLLEGREKHGRERGNPKLDRHYTTAHTSGREQSPLSISFFNLPPLFSPFTLHLHPTRTHSHHHGSRDRTSQVRFRRGCHQGYRYEQRDNTTAPQKCLLRSHLSSLSLHQVGLRMGRETARTSQQDNKSSRRTFALPTFIAGTRSHPSDSFRTGKQNNRLHSSWKTPDQQTKTRNNSGQNNKLFYSFCSTARDNTRLTNYT